MGFLADTVFEVLSLARSDAHLGELWDRRYRGPNNFFLEDVRQFTIIGWARRIRYRVT